MNYIAAVRVFKIYADTLCISVYPYVGIIQIRSWVKALQLTLSPLDTRAPLFSYVTIISLPKDSGNHFLKILLNLLYHIPVLRICEKLLLGVHLKCSSPLILPLIFWHKMHVQMAALIPISAIV